ncbi:MAG: DALR anticodon-binding domain-containing protein [Cyanobacteria bacterium P01_A01_bin.84]
MAEIGLSVYNNTLVSKYTAVIKLVDSCLQEAISSVICTKNYTYLAEKYIHLHQGRDSSKNLYITEIVLKLSKSQNLQNMRTAEAIASCLEKNNSEILRVKIVPPGLLYLEPSDLTLAVCLQNLLETSNLQLGYRENKNKQSNKPSNKLVDTGSLFTVQYAHARCCSLIELARQENLLVWAQQEINQNCLLGKFITPNPIPWLKKDRPQQLYFHQPTELILMNKLIEVADNLELDTYGKSKNWQKIAVSVSQAFDGFWAQCRILGEVKIDCLELTQARCGLIIVTQMLLKRLLEEKLNIYAPSRI